MKKAVIISAVAATFALGAAAFAQSNTQQGSSSISSGIGQPLTGQAAVDYGQQTGGTGLMGPGVTGPRSSSSADGSGSAASSAGSYSTNTAAQASDQTSRTTTGTGSAMGTGSSGMGSNGSSGMASGSSYSQGDSSAMRRAGERG